MNALHRMDEVSFRGARARKILTEARRHLLGHVPRERRVAAALELARCNIVKFDPKRFPSMLAPVHAEQLHRQAAAARQRRVARVLGEARATLKRLSRITPPSQNSEIVHKTTEHTRVAVEAPSSNLRRTEAATVSVDAMERLSDRVETFRQAVPVAMGEMIADLRTELLRENNCLLREIDVLKRELDLLRRTLAGLRALPS
jgi:hypothetical protein